MLEKEKRQNMKNMEKENFKKRCSEGKKSAHFRCHYLFLENVTFLVPIESPPNTTKIGVSADTGENPKWHFWLQKCHFGFSLEKGFYYLWCLKAVFRWKHYFYSVFSKTQLCRHERMYLDKKQKFTKNSGCLPKCKKVFFWYVFFVFWWFCFLLPVFLFLCFVKRPKKAIFLQF